MNSLLLTIAQLCQLAMPGSYFGEHPNITCQKKLIECAKGNSVNFQSDSATEAKLAECVMKGVHK